MSKTGHWAQGELNRALELLAAAPEDQLAHLRSIGCEQAVDELALELDDIFPEGGPAEGVALTAGQLKSVQEVQAKLVAMSGQENEELWQPEALTSRPEWAEVRTAASRALAALK